MAEAQDGERQRRYERKQAALGADIGALPAVADAQRREACRLDLQRFLVTYFPASTGLSPFSDDHTRVIARIQRCILEGGRFVNAVYRGFAKTTITENAALWATLYAHRRFVVLFGAAANAASGNLDSIKVELSENELLQADFPEVCHPIACLEGKPQRCASQTHIPGHIDGTPPASDAAPARTHIEWTAEKIVFPSIALPTGPSPSSGAVLSCRGVTAGTRGLKHKRPDGGQQRPDWVILDDPQTDESARTAHQVAKRMGLLKKSICKLGGHHRPIAITINATVIEPDDLIDQLLDPKRNPAWQGERIPMVRHWSKVHDTLWLDQYATLRNTYSADIIGDQARAHAAATKFYKQHRKAMDAGCAVSWKHCFQKDVEISAIQHAYNALIDDGPEVFASEFQNSPQRAQTEGVSELRAAEIAARTNGLERGRAPLPTEHITAFIDVHDSLLYWCVCAWSAGFTGALLDCGTFPQQSRAQFSLRDARATLALAFPGAAKEARIHAGLTTLSDDLFSRDWIREDQAPLRIGRCLIDARDGDVSQIVRAVCTRSAHAAALLPSMGKYVGAAAKPMTDHKPKAGEKLGTNWLISAGAGKAGRCCYFDTNWWKSFVAARLRTAIGGAGAVTLWGKEPAAHALWAQHCCAEYSVRTEGRGRIVDEWKIRPERPDNHWWDCLIGCHVAASVEGLSLAQHEPRRAPRRTFSLPGGS